MAVKKIYYSMGEVAEMFDVRPSLIRHWESQFACLKPHKNQKGNRMFTEADIEKLKQIYHLVKERGMTLKGAAQVMRRSSQDELARQTQLLERLQRIRAALIEVREELKTGDGEQVVEESGDDDVEVAVAAETPAKKPAKRVAKPKTEPEPETLEVVAEPAEEDEPAEEQPKRRAPRRKKKSDDETKELFPFYEQSLF
ncbi:MAG: MerR family transcriptional regulator [Alistipes sp.]|nr:MerR family transcriptional regulator [Alistipes sp.]